MTLLWSERHPHDHRSLENRQGAPYYGSALREIMAAPLAKPSLLGRAGAWWRRNELRLLVVFGVPALLFVLGCAVYVIAKTGQIQ
jgi:hypothetical protein